MLQLALHGHRKDFCHGLLDLLTSLTGVGFEEAWAGREPADRDHLPVFFIGSAAFLKNKRVTGRAQDLAGLERLGGH